MPKNILFLFLFSVFLFSTKLYASQPQSAFDVMTFEDGFTCNDKFPHHSFCEAVEFKAWTESEKEIVSNYLKNINSPRLKYFLQVLKKKGITKLHRVVYGSRWFSNQQLRRVEFSRSNESAILWVDPVTQVIGFTDSFFNGSTFIDPLANIERKQFNVLHELAHVFDMASGHFSSSKEFALAAGWYWDGENHVLRNSESINVNLEFLKLISLVKNKQATAAYQSDRELGVKLGFPTIYSMVNQHESFAEILTYLILDPTAESYLSPNLVSYYKNILKY